MEINWVYTEMIEHIISSVNMPQIVNCNLHCIIQLGGIKKGRQYIAS